MANIWENAVITNKGVALNAKVMAGGKINITSVKSGSGTVSTAVLMNQTSVSDIKQTLSLKPIQKNGNTTILPVMLENDGLTSAYDLRQVGIYAEDPDEGEILYMLAQNTQARHVPSESEIPGYSLVWNFHITVANGVEMEVYVNPAGAVPLDKYEKEVGAMHDASLAGYYVHDGESFSGYASNSGVDIGLIKGNSFQEKSNGNQLFDAKSVKTQSSGGATVTNNNDGSFTVTGSGNLTGAFETRYHISHEDFTKLFRVGLLRLKTEKTTYPFMYINLYKDNSFVQTIFSNKWQASSSFELKQEHFDEDYSLYIGFNGAVGEAMISGTIKPMLYQDGDGTWEPFTGGKAGPCPEYPLEIKDFEVSLFEVFNSNMFDVESALSFQRLGTTNASGCYSNYGNGVKTDWNSNENGRTYMHLPLKAGAYTLSADVASGNTSWNFSVKDYKSGNVILTKNYLEDGKISETFVIEEDGMIGFCFMNLNANGASTTAINIQLSKGINAASYTAFQKETVSCGPIVLRSVNGVCDTYSDGKITRRIGTVDLSTLSWSYGNGWQQATISDIKYVSSNLEIGNAMCDCYRIRQASGFTISEKGEFAIDTSNIKFNTGSTEKPTGILYYELANPIIESVKIPTLPSYFPYTNIHHNSVLVSSGFIWNANTKSGRVDKLTSSNGELLLFGLDGIQYIDSEKNQYSIFGQHNKPYGTYIGDDNAPRYISVGGIGKILFLRGPFGDGFVHENGAFFHESTGNNVDTTWKTFGGDYINFSNGELRITTSHSYYNYSGATYSYQVL